MEVIVPAKRYSAESALSDELAERVKSMEVTGDVPAEERTVTALEDIISLDARDHGAYTASEIRDWKAIQRAARLMLASILHRSVT